jgi:hypothetical protein
MTSKTQPEEYSGEENYSHFVRNVIKRKGEELNELLSKHAMQLARLRVKDEQGGEPMDHFRTILEGLAREFWSVWGGLYNVCEEYSDINDIVYVGTGRIHS